MELFTKEDVDLIREAFRKDVEDFKSLFKSAKGLMTITEFIARFIPSILFVLLALIFSNSDANFTNGLVVMGIPLFFVAVWAVINHIAVKRFGVNA